ncbi:DciA family protein [Methylovulum miyakonense]|uniref:DciA family protein n=1 Tax=Methylovulum miyakonense TaxID=645578 RepID=UPI00037379F3|nr:DciA family protein [Methylovulum miyakonense]
MPKKPFHIPLAFQNRILGFFHSQIEQQKRILQHVRRGLPENLAKHACHCLISGNSLVVYTDSAMWASQLRFYTQAMLANIEPLTRGGVQKVQIKIMTVNTGAVSQPVFKAKIPSAATLDMMQKQSLSIRDGELRLALQRLNSTLKKLAG